MSKYATQKLLHGRAIEQTWRAMAGACIKDAERGIFLPIGKRCEYCLHSMSGGRCRLTLLAQAAE